MDAATEFLTIEECALVDAALLTARDKFTARVAIYALRSLKIIAQTQECPISELPASAIPEWVAADSSLQNNLDDHFKAFFAQLVTSSLKPLKQAAAAANVKLEDLTIEQLIQWFEQQAKFNLKVE